MGLVVRRVRSNIDDAAEFARSVDYVPCRVGFEAANPDLLKLLVGPLYGNAPEIALRELVQNAVDSVRELREYLRHDPDRRAETVTADALQVVVEFKQDATTEWRVIVRDRGIGMSLTTVLDYFLKVGASYRQSDAWRDRFEYKPGKAKVLRSGRFGIGVLASFLLGQEIHVLTRHIDSRPDEGISFATSLDEELIEIKYVRAPVGTTITIRVRGKRAAMLNEWFKLSKYRSGYSTGDYGFDDMDGYCLADPRVTRIVSRQAGASVPIEQSYELPMPTSVRL